MKLDELNGLLKSHGIRAVNGNPDSFDQYGWNLREREDGLWVIASDNGRGSLQYWKPADVPTQYQEFGGTLASDGAIAFSTLEAACDFLWTFSTRAPARASNRRVTANEIEISRQAQARRFEKAIAELQENAGEDSPGSNG